MKLQAVMLSITLLFSGVGGVVLAGSHGGHQHSDTISVENPYVRAVPPGQPNSASFMNLTNNSQQDRALVAAESDVSKVVELHTHTMSEGVMQMRKVDKIELPAGKTVSLEPGGLHVMLIGLKQDLMPGSDVAVTLVFDDGSRQAITAPVKKMKMKMMDKEKHHHH